MTWEEIIIKIRQLPEYSELVHQCYLSDDLKNNVDRFKNSEEFCETLKIITRFAPTATIIADIGSGNGISAAAFSFHNYSVIAVEPNKSNTVGSEAILWLKEKLHSH